jgi:hypothetical protein
MNYSIAGVMKLLSMYAVVLLLASSHTLFALEWREFRPPGRPRAASSSTPFGVVVDLHIHTVFFIY